MNMRIIWVVIGMICLSGSSDFQAAAPGQDPFAGCDAGAVDADEAANIARIRANALAMRRQAEADQRLNNGHFLQFKPVVKQQLAADHGRLVKKQDDIRAKLQAVRENLPSYAKELASQEAEAIVAAICPLSLRNQVALWSLLHTECSERTLEMKIALFKKSGIPFDVYQAVLKEEFADADKLVALVRSYPAHGLSARTVARELLHAPVPVGDKALADILATDVFSDDYKRVIYETVIPRRPAFYKQVRTYLMGKNNKRNVYAMAQWFCTAWVKETFGSSRGDAFKSITPETGMIALQDLFDTHHAAGRSAFESMSNICAGLFVSGMCNAQIRDQIFNFWLNQPIEEIDKNIAPWLYDECLYESWAEQEECMQRLIKALEHKEGGKHSETYRLCRPLRAHGAFGEQASHDCSLYYVPEIGRGSAAADSSSGSSSSGSSSVRETRSSLSGGSDDLRQMCAMAKPSSDGSASIGECSSSLSSGWENGMSVEIGASALERVRFGDN